MRAKISICPKHNLPRMTTHGRLRCRECKREAASRTRARTEEDKSLYALKIAQQKAEDAALDAHVEKIWREKFAGGEAVYYREILSEDAGAAMLAKHGVKVVRNFSDPVKAESFYNDLEESVKTNQEAA